MKRSGSTTAATAEKPALDDKQRVERLALLALLAERLRRPDGLDRDTLERIEHCPATSSPPQRACKLTICCARTPRSSPTRRRGGA